MKKVINLVLAVLITGCVNAQWSYEVINNGFDEPYRIATTPVNNDAYAYMLNLDSAVVLAVIGGYYCDDYPTVDVVLTVSEVNKKFQFNSYKSKSSDIIYITWDMGENPEFVNDFKRASNMKIRINESYCTSEIYTYKMTSSKAAYDYIAKP
jgi:hypothetical protein